MKISASTKKEKNYLEENKKLKAKVTNNKEYITELLEEKAQAEEQYLKEKQITTG